MFAKRTIGHLNREWEKILTSFFKSTTTAVNAINAEFTFKAYYNWTFQVDAFFSFFAHVLRAINNLCYLALRLLIAPLYLLNPLAWPGVPAHMMNVVDNTVALAVALLTLAVAPIVFVMRTLTSLVRGYEENTPAYDYGYDAACEELDAAMTIFNP